MSIFKKIVNVAADKWLHFIVGMALAQVVIAVLDWCVADKFVVYGAGMAAALVAGFVKELKDGSNADIADFVFTLIGGVVGAVLAVLIWI